MTHHPRYTFRLLSTAILLASTGCAAFRSLEGVPASQLPEEFRAPTRSARKMIDLSRLRQTPPDVHRVDTGDILGIYVEGYLGGQQQAPPVNFPQNPNSTSSVGYPIEVRADGEISLPGRKPIPVRGMTIPEVELAVRRLYTTGKKPPLQPGFERVLVTLQRPRHRRVLVIRQEAANTVDIAGQTGPLGTARIAPNGKFGTGQVVHLPIYRNDVLHALLATGGLPGRDAENVIYVIRRRTKRRSKAPAAKPQAVRRSAPPKPRVRTVPTEKPAPITQQPPVRTQPVFQRPVPKTHGYSPLRIRNFKPVNPASKTGIESLLIRGQSPDIPDGNRGHSLPSLPPLLTTPPPPTPSRTAMRTEPAVQVETPQIASPVISQPDAPFVLTPESDAAFANAVPQDQQQILRIPLRVYPGEPMPFSESDIVLEDGDVVLIESRDADVFFTGGLLGGGRYRLPRDQDLDILQALAMVQTQRVSILPDAGHRRHFGFEPGRDRQRE